MLYSDYSDLIWWIIHYLSLLPDFLSVYSCLWVIAHYHDESYFWHTKRKYTSRLMMASGSVFEKRGRLRFWEASLLSASYTSRFILRLETRERETEKKREHFLELQSLWMTWWEKKLVKMKVWFIYYYSSFLCKKLLLIDFLNKKWYKPYV